MKLRFEANITLMLREQDINLLRKALQQFKAEDEDEARLRKYLLGFLEYLATPE